MDKQYNLTQGWKIVTLSDICEIIVSNVDKKISLNEVPVFLCNYMNVYTNDYLDTTIPFSEGSVTKEEFLKYRLNIDDVIITKDSETPDDIAIPSVVTEELSDVVCGYHLAILRPKGNNVFGQFLSKSLHSTMCRTHFSRLASGATRYGLSLNAIHSCPILLPSFPHQRIISLIIQSLDKTIEITEQLIAKYESIKTGLMQDLLENAEEKKKWKTVSLADICEINPPKPRLNQNILVSFLAMSDVSDSAKIIGEDERPVHKVWRGYTSFQDGDILVAKITPCFENGKGAFAIDLKNGYGFGSTEFHVLRPHESISNRLVYYITTGNKFRTAGKAIMTGSAGQQRVQSSFFYNYKFPFPSDLKEQETIANVLEQQDNLILSESKNLHKYVSLKSALMQDLLTGKVSVDALLKEPIESV